MRRGYKFTPVKINNWIKAGRGTGTFADYNAWHQVRRGDPSSRGLSHLANCSLTGRLHHFLSSMESEVFGFLTMLPNLVDIREQYPLSLDSHPLDISPYCSSALNQYADGTLAIAEQLGFKHPVLTNGLDKMPWTMSTDIVSTYLENNGIKNLLPISVKYDTNIKDKRTIQLLKIEQSYWDKQNHEWLLITPSQSELSVRLTVRKAMPWAIPKSPDRVAQESHLMICQNLVSEFSGQSLKQCLLLLQSCIDQPLHYIQGVFWQAVWKGLLPIALNNPLQFSAPIRMLSTEEFISQNPVLSRRSLWK